MDIIVKNTKTPLLIENTLNWQLLKWDLDKWKEILGNEKLIFRCGKNCSTSEPQFENLTSTLKMTFEEFLKLRTDEQWFYFDYKYLKDWLVDCEELRKNICWTDFGFPDLTVEDSTIWIGSKGAHTPCHVDSYGCNIVAQIYGRKRWMLFPPEEDLQSTRIPYEESSTFSKINFFAPSDLTLSDISKCYSVVLNPGDVLVVPHKWWHYVENLEMSISINTWIQLSADYKERVKEAIVRTSVIQYLKELHPQAQKGLLTANVEPSMFDESPHESTSLILKCLQQLKENKKDQTNQNLSNITEMLTNFPNIKEIQPLTKGEFQKLLNHQQCRFKRAAKNDGAKLQDDLKDLKKVLDAVVHSDVVDLIYKKLYHDNK